MGQDKALLIFEGEHLIQCIVRRLKGLFDEIFVITGETKRYEKLLDVPVLEDSVKGKGPLGGLYTGLKACRNEWAFVIACDMPFVKPKIIEVLINQQSDKSSIIAFEINGYRTPALGLYHKACLSEIERRIRANELSLKGLFAALSVKLISEREARQVDPELLSFVNLNRPEEVQRAIATQDAVARQNRLKAWNGAREIRKWRGQRK